MKKSIGGRTRTSGANAKGSGPVWELRQQCKNEDGSVISQSLFSKMTYISRTLIQTCEREGRWPNHPIYKGALVNWAEKNGKVVSE